MFAKSAILLAGLLAAALLALSAHAETDEAAKAELKAGWDAFVMALSMGREAIDNPALFPPESTNRNLSDGYRYLLGHLARLFEREMHQDPDFPYFQRTLGMISKYTIDSADTAYYTAAIDPDGRYKISGRLRNDGSDGDDKGKGRKKSGPRFLSIAAITGHIGDTGSLQELGDCSVQTVSALTTFELSTDDKGRFKILVAPEPDPEWDGDYLATKAILPCVLPDGTVLQLPKQAIGLAARQIFSDWQNEEVAYMEIVRLDKEGERGGIRNATDTAAQLASIGEKVANQIKFWSLLNEFGLEVNGDRNADGRRNLPLNDLNPAAPPFIAGGTAGAGQLYSAGIFELAPDEALVIELEMPVEAHYFGIALSNLWGESLNQADNTISRSGDQTQISSDGKRYYVVSHEDLGVPNWLDTTALEKGQMTLRFIYPDVLDPSQRPTMVVTKVLASEVWDQLPADTPFVDEAARRKEIALRQEHIKLRYRH